MFSPRLPTLSGNALLGSATLAVALLLLPALGRYAASDQAAPVTTSGPAVLVSPAPSAVAPSIRPTEPPRAVVTLPPIPR